MCYSIAAELRVTGVSSSYCISFILKESFKSRVVCVCFQDLKTDLVSHWRSLVDKGSASHSTVLLETLGTTFLKNVFGI